MKIQLIAAIATAAGALVAPTAAHASSDVAGPPQHYTFVQDAGAPCDFPVQWDVVDKEGVVFTTKFIINTSPASKVTLTNMDTGTTYSPTGNAVVRNEFLEDGTQIIHQSGLGTWPGIGMFTRGDWSRAFYPDGTRGPLTGTGSAWSYCDALS
jgi:hypothetical protein